jgi:hypothetical protein
MILIWMGRRVSEVGQIDSPRLKDLPKRVNPPND